jgi:hypothetical protein
MHTNNVTQNPNYKNQQTKHTQKNENTETAVEA